MTTIVEGAPFIPGTILPSRVFGPVTMTDIVRYQGASGDLNPMHHDDELAQAAGYPAAFSVGMLGAGYLATYCTDLYGTDAVRRFRTRFEALVFRGALLAASGRVTRLADASEGPRVELELSVVDAAGTRVISGSAELLVARADPEHDRG
jgi:acyl dehydratase